MSNVQIIDAIMGSGKTYDAIERMKKKKGSFMYVTPFLDEVERIVKSVPGVSDPKVTYVYDQIEEEYTTIYKRANLLRMANGKINMATTHSLFQKLNRNDYTYFKDYDLILDEVLTPIQVIDMKPDDIKIAFNEGLLVENKDNGEVTYTGEDYNGRFYAKLKQYCDTANVIHVNDKLLVWAFPPEIFQNFKSVTVLTYLFEGSLLAAYFKYYQISYKIKRKSPNAERQMKMQIKKLLNIYDGAKNDVGNTRYAFSVNWLKNKSKIDLKKIGVSAENLIKQNYKTSCVDNAYTTFKAYQSNLKAKGYTSGFLPVNERATNKYSNKKTMIYFANRFLDPNVIEFFRNRGIDVDHEQWALSELIQWVWRGTIRNGQPMNLFIPSKRMRQLLNDWLDDKGSSSTLIGLQKAA